MTNARWNWIEAASVVLAEPEREAILGDLAESSDSFLHALQNILGLAFRRHLELWANWRPWAASFGLALPASLFLMCVSLAVSHDFFLLPTAAGNSLSPALIGKTSLLAIWACMAGYAAVAISRRTLWATALACIAPCLTCFMEWPDSPLSALRLLLFLVPAICGAAYAKSQLRMHRNLAFLLAASGLFVPWMWHQGGGLYGLGLLWPGCFLLTTARRSAT
jgi:hypothetical protein